MDFKIVEIDLAKKKDLNAFIDLPWKIYKNDPHWVPPLKMAVRDLLNPKHPFYKTADVKTWLAVKPDGEVIGRIMGIHNYTYNKYEKNNIGHFGFFEVIDDIAVSKALMDVAATFVKTKGMTSIQGPMNPGTNYECGILVDKFDDAPQIMMTYNPSYYVSHLDEMGLKKAMDLLAYNLEGPNFKLPDIIHAIADRTEKKSSITYRKLNLKKWKEELDIMFDIYNSAWEENWGFVPMSKEEFYHTAKDLKSIVDPNLVNFTLVDGIEAGFILSLPDLNQIFKTIPKGTLSLGAIYKIMTPKKRITRVRTVMMGIKKEYRKMGLETLLYRNSKRAIMKNPLYKDIEMSWILETNIEMNKPLLRMCGYAYKRYRLVEKAI
ncbi:MAG: hypothetical protein K2Q18_19520 [Bdellovibrionales bacterium]|nr:hypothetical protein [Bdellovibrionales bacterium]